MARIREDAKGLISHGINACQGCAMELIIRNVLDILGEDTIVLVPPGCAAMLAGYGDETALKTAGMQTNLENAAAVAAGIRAGLDIQGNDHTKVLVFAGDGATVDIGLQALSGVLERRDDIIYICYDNEAYMNTGIQGSSSTPQGASTTTTPGGKPTFRKNLMAIVEAHNIPYAASASVARLSDMRKKIEKARDIKGPCFLHIHAPCPTGWLYPFHLTMEVARAAVDTGAWTLYEVEDGKRRITNKPRELRPLADYFALQKRFAGVSEDEVEAIEKQVRAQYERLTASCG